MLFAIADAMHEEYKAITDAGIILQLDDPDLPDGYHVQPDMSVEEYRKFAEVRVEAINHAIRDIPEELVRLHICWGSSHHPHTQDIPLSDIIDIVFKVKAQCYSIEAANPQHEHEWEVFEDHPLPDGKILMPGVLGHCVARVRRAPAARGPAPAALRQPGRQRERHRRHGLRPAARGARQHPVGQVPRHARRPRHADGRPVAPVLDAGDPLRRAAGARTARRCASCCWART